MQVLATIITTIAAAMIATAASAASAAKTGPAVCALTDLSKKAVACKGFYSGNLVAGSPSAIASQKAALGLLGYKWDGAFSKVETIASLNGAHSVMFNTVLKGISFIALHFGGGTGGPGEATAFYELDAGTGLARNTLTFAYDASSNAALYATNVRPIGTGGGSVGTVPEPASSALLIGGFGFVGGALRDKRAAVVA